MNSLLWDFTLKVVFSIKSTEPVCFYKIKHPIHVHLKYYNYWKRAQYCIIWHLRMCSVLLKLYVRLTSKTKLYADAHIKTKERKSHSCMRHTHRYTVHLHKDEKKRKKLYSAWVIDNTGEVVPSKKEEVLYNHRNYLGNETLVLKCHHFYFYF